MSRCLVRCCPITGNHILSSRYSRCLNLLLYLLVELIVPRQYMQRKEEEEKYG